MPSLWQLLCSLLLLPAAFAALLPLLSKMRCGEVVALAASAAGLPPLAVRPKEEGPPLDIAARKCAGREAQGGAAARPGRSVRLITCSYKDISR